MRVYVKTCVNGGSADRDGRILVRSRRFSLPLMLSHPNQLMLLIH